MNSYLSKSDFKVAQDCPTKLFYKKQYYPSIDEENEYLQKLAEGGYMVEKIAKLLHPDGFEVGFDRAPEEAFHATQEALRADNVTLFEATLISNGKLARLDILRKRGNEFDLVEVKAKSYNSQENARAIRDGYRSLFRNKDGSISAKWQEYLEDVTFQTLVLQSLYPGSTVHPFLCMPDKSRTTGIDRLYSQFKLRRAARDGARYERIEVEFTGDVGRLRTDHFLVEVPVADDVEYLAEDVQAKADRYAASLQPQVTKISVPLTTQCAKCEYHALGEGGRDGFHECWGELADVKPHILDLYRVGQLGGGLKSVKADDLIHDRKVSLFDVTGESLRKKDNTIGSYGARQLVQIKHTRENTEWIGDELLRLLRAFRYPLHFVDFETAAGAIPCHSGMRPYEQVAFQWSCHTVSEPGGSVAHYDWINVADAFPNFEFAETLMQRIGTAGTVFKYATHETTILNAIRKQMDQRGYGNVELARWLDEMGAKDRLIDMYHGMTLKHYFHPLMKGDNSIKRVVDAIWKTSPQIRARFPEYLREVDGQILSPYESLPPLAIQGKDFVVAEGTGAMRAYEAMMYGLEKDDTGVRDQWKQLLLQYCKLDTLAMVILWQHWSEKA